jgi:Domain of unknown function (DUF4388)
VALVGQLSEFQLVNIIALLQVERKTGELTLQDEEQHTVRLYLKGGLVIHAEGSGATGHSAPTDGFEMALEPFTWPGGKFHFEDYDIPIPEPNIAQGNVALVTAGRDRANAFRETSRNVPSANLVLKLVHQPANSMQSISLDFYEWRFLTMVDTERDLNSIATMLGVTEQKVRGIASKMLKNGLVEKVELRTRMHKLHAFTAEDNHPRDLAVIDDLDLDVMAHNDRELVAGAQLEVLTPDEQRHELLRVVGYPNMADRIMLAPMMMARLGLTNGDPVYVRLRDLRVAV